MPRRSPRPGGKEVTFRVSRGIGISLARLGKSDPNPENFDPLIHRRQSSAPPRSGHFSRLSSEKLERCKTGRSDADMRAKRLMSGKPDWKIPREALDRRLDCALGSQ